MRGGWEGPRRRGRGLKYGGGWGRVSSRYGSEISRGGVVRGYKIHLPDCLHRDTPLSRLPSFRYPFLNSPSTTARSLTPSPRRPSSNHPREEIRNRTCTSAFPLPSANHDSRPGGGACQCTQTHTSATVPVPRPFHLRQEARLPSGNGAHLVSATFFHLATSAPASSRLFPCCTAALLAHPYPLLEPVYVT